MMTGNFFIVTVAGGRANIGGFPFHRANRTCYAKLAAAAAPLAGSSPSAVSSLRCLGTFGNSGRNIIETPGLNNWDVSFLKDTPLKKGGICKSAPEFFNFCNHAQCNAPDANAGSAFHGWIRTVQDGRISQPALKLLR